PPTPPPKAPEAPRLPDAEASIGGGADARRRRAASQGRSGSILTSGAGVTSFGATTTKTLLGQ
ncbi:MAG: hypothetical protein GY941_14425, partial [Planctomycetes bacterium]|nr:hypothetical protein [Planctomycetota bacterium]